MLSKPKSRRVAIALALLSAIPIPFFPAGWHKFYLGQRWWGVSYLLLSLTPMPRVASLLECIWYLAQNEEEFDQHFNPDLVETSLPRPRRSSSVAVDPAQVSGVASALRDLDQLRQDGLISEYEFEQKRRQLLDRIA